MAAVVASAALVAAVAAAWLLGNRNAAFAMLIPVSAAVVSILRWAAAGSRMSPLPDRSHIDELVERLADVVRRQWRSEANCRQLLGADRLTVRWRASRLPVMVNPAVAGTVRGQTNHMDSLVRAFNRLRHRRLVILGEPGSGKTSLAVLLTLELLSQRSRGDPVPVLLSAATWDPKRGRLRQWVEKRLGDEYAKHIGVGSSSPALHMLVNSDRVLPVIDGLDELSPTGLRAALTAINQDQVAGDPIIVTCRPDAFLGAVGAVGPLAGAAVIEPEPVRALDAIAYVRNALVEPQLALWQPVFAAVERASPTSALTSALTNPLLIWLTRAVYGTPDANPAELIDTQRFPDRVHIEGHLLDSLVPTLINRANRGEPGTETKGEWDPDGARRWLTFIATHLSRYNSRDLAWWRLGADMRVIVGELILYVLFVSVVFGFTFSFAFGPSRGFLDGLIAGLTATLIVGLVLRLVSGNLPRQRGQRAGGHVSLGWALRTSLQMGLVVGLGSGFVFARMVGPATGLLGGIEFAIEYGLVGAVLGFLLAGPRALANHRRRRSGGQFLERAGGRLLSRLLAFLLVGMVQPGRYARAALRVRARFVSGVVGALGAWMGVVMFNVLMSVIERRGLPELRSQLRTVLGFGLMDGLALGLMIGLAPRAGPARGNFHIGGRLYRLIRWLLYGLAIGGFLAFLVHISFGLGSGAGYQWELDLGDGLGLGSARDIASNGGAPTFQWVVLAIGVLIGIVLWSHTAVEDDEGASMRSTLRDDRRFTLVVGILLMPTMGLLTVQTIPNWMYLELALRYGVEFGLLFMLMRPWPRYMIARIWLSLRRQLPWRLTTFLEDADKLGILRQVGAIYQFRHARLQDHLSANRVP